MPGDHCHRYLVHALSSALIRRLDTLLRDRAHMGKPEVQLFNLYPRSSQPRAVTEIRVVEVAENVMKIEII